MSDQDTSGDSPAPYSIELALQFARHRRAGKLVGFDEDSVIFALLEEVEKHQKANRPTIPNPLSPEAQVDDVLVSFGDMRGFNMSRLKELMAGGVDDNHEGMVEEHLKVFNYAVTQGIHPGQALLAGIQAIGCLIGYAIRSGMHPNVGAAFTALIIKSTEDAAKNVQIVTTN